MSAGAGGTERSTQAGTGGSDGEATVPPALGVITICRNALPALRRTVESVLVQRPPSFEYWIVDGGSRDGTIEYLGELAALGVRTFSEPDRGISDAMNKGARLATAEWIAHLHAGDEYLPGALAKVAQAIARHPDADVLCGYLVKREPAGDVIYRCDPTRLKLDMTINHPATFVRRSTFLAHEGFDLGYRRAMDYEFFLKLERAGARFEVIPEPLAAMDHGGFSEGSLWETLRESERARRTRLASGFARTSSYTALLYLRGAVRRFLQRVGLESLVSWYRRRFAVLRKG